MLPLANILVKIFFTLVSTLQVKYLIVEKQLNLLRGSYVAGKSIFCDMVASRSFIFHVCLNLMAGYNEKSFVN